MKPTDIPLAMAAVRERYPDARVLTRNEERRVLELLAEPWVTRQAFDVVIDALFDRQKGESKWPGRRQIERLLKQAKPDVVHATHDEAVRLCVERFGHEFLALGAVPWSTPCGPCQLDDRWAILGGEPDEPLLNHAHLWDRATLAPVLTRDEHGLDRFWNWTEATFVHAITYCGEYAPDGTRMEFPATYHPLRARAGSTAEWLARVERANEAGRPRAEAIRAQFKAQFGIGPKVVAACGFCGDRKQQPVYAERADGSVIQGKVAYWVACKHCVPAGELAELF